MKIAFSFEYEDSNRRDTALMAQITQLVNERDYRMSGASSISFSRNENQTSSIKVLIDENTQFKNEKKELEKQIERYRKDTEKNQEEIKNRDTEIEKLKTDVNTLNQLLKEAEEDAKKKEEETKKELDTEQAKFRELERRLGNENLKLNKRIEELQKKLETYEPNVGGNPGEELHYDICGEFLSQTNDHTAPYVAKNGGDNSNYIFHFNVDKGPVKEACDKKEEYFGPFCEIINEIPEGANSILRDKWGKAQVTPSGDLKILERAKIKLIKI